MHWSSVSPYKERADLLYRMVHRSCAAAVLLLMLSNPAMAQFCPGCPPVCTPCQPTQIVKIRFTLIIRVTTIFQSPSPWYACRQQIAAQLQISTTFVSVFSSELRYKSGYINQLSARQLLQGSDDGDGSELEVEISLPQDANTKPEDVQSIIESQDKSRLLGNNRDLQESLDLPDSPEETGFQVSEPQQVEVPEDALTDIPQPLSEDQAIDQVEVPENEVVQTPPGSPLAPPLEDLQPSPPLDIPPGPQQPPEVWFLL